MPATPEADHLIRCLDCHRGYMRYPIYQIDAFADRPFTGNPAAVVFSEQELPAALMQAIAAENNLSETAFVCHETGDLSIRWFTPVLEVELYGHATLAAAHAIFAYRAPDDTGRVFFTSKSGRLGVFSRDGLLWLDFPADQLTVSDDLRGAVQAALNCPVQRVLRGRHDLMALLDSESAVARLLPDLELVRRLECRGLIVTSAGHEVDFVSRFFAPRAGIDEDPVTGSAHTTLAPYWSGIHGKSELTAFQLSARGGRLQCRLVGDRVQIGGQAITYMEGEISIETDY